MVSSPEFGTKKRSLTRVVGYYISPVVGQRLSHASVVAAVSKKSVSTVLNSIVQQRASAQCQNYGVQILLLLEVMLIDTPAASNIGYSLTWPEHVLAAIKAATVASRCAGRDPVRKNWSHDGTKLGPNQRRPLQELTGYSVARVWSQERERYTTYRRITPDKVRLSGLGRGFR